MNRTLGTLNEKRKVLVLQHADSENLGTIEDELRAAGVGFNYVRSFEGQEVADDASGLSGLIVMGGPMGVYETDRFPFLLRELRLIEHFLNAHKPILGICLGSELLAAALGAMVRKGRKKEIGWFPIQLGPASEGDHLWRGQPSRFIAYHWHGDVFELPSGAVTLASSDITPVQSYRFEDRAYGILFHLEVTELHIERMIEEFADEIQQEHLDSAGILNPSKTFLPQVQQIAAMVFRRWIELL